MPRGYAESVPVVHFPFCSSSFSNENHLEAISGNYDTDVLNWMFSQYCLNQLINIPGIEKLPQRSELTAKAYPLSTGILNTHITFYDTTWY